MDWFRVILSTLLISGIAGISLKCGEDIVIQRGQKRVLRFWSSEDESLNVDILPTGSDAGSKPLSSPEFQGAITGISSSINNPAQVGTDSSATSGVPEESSESNKFRTDLEIIDTEEGVSDPESENELYYSYNLETTSKPDNDTLVDEGHEIPEALPGPTSSSQTVIQIDDNQKPNQDVIISRNDATTTESNVESPDVRLQSESENTNISYDDREALIESTTLDSLSQQNQGQEKTADDVEVRDSDLKENPEQNKQTQTNEIGIDDASQVTPADVLNDSQEQFIETTTAVPQFKQKKGQEEIEDKEKVSYSDQDESLGQSKQNPTDVMKSDSLVFVTPAEATNDNVDQSTESTTVSSRFLSNQEQVKIKDQQNVKDSTLNENLDQDSEMVASKMGTNDPEYATQSDILDNSEEQLAESTTLVSQLLLNQELEEINVQERVKDSNQNENLGLNKQVLTDDLENDESVTTMSADILNDNEEQLIESTTIVSQSQYKQEQDEIDGQQKVKNPNLEENTGQSNQKKTNKVGINESVQITLENIPNDNDEHMTETTTLIPQFLQKQGQGESKDQQKAKDTTQTENPEQNNEELINERGADSSEQATEVMSEKISLTDAIVFDPELTETTTLFYWKNHKGETSKPTDSSIDSNTESSVEITTILGTSTSDKSGTVGTSASDASVLMKDKISTKNSGQSDAHSIQQSSPTHKEDNDSQLEGESKDKIVPGQKNENVINGVTEVVSSTDPITRLYSDELVTEIYHTKNNYEFVTTTVSTNNNDKLELSKPLVSDQTLIKLEDTAISGEASKTAEEAVGIENANEPVIKAENPEDYYTTEYFKEFLDDSSNTEDEYIPATIQPPISEGNEVKDKSSFNEMNDVDNDDLPKGSEINKLDFKEEVFVHDDVQSMPAEVSVATVNEGDSAFQDTDDSSSYQPEFFASEEQTTEENVLKIKNQIDELQTVSDVASDHETSLELKTDVPLTKADHPESYYTTEYINEYSDDNDNSEDVYIPAGTLPPISEGNEDKDESSLNEMKNTNSDDLPKDSESNKIVQKQDVSAHEAVPSIPAEVSQAIANEGENVFQDADNSSSELQEFLANEEQTTEGNISKEKNQIHGIQAASAIVSEQEATFEVNTETGNTSQDFESENNENRTSDTTNDYLFESDADENQLENSYIPTSVKSEDDPENNGNRFKVIPVIKTTNMGASAESSKIGNNEMKDSVYDGNSEQFSDKNGEKNSEHPDDDNLHNSEESNDNSNNEVLTEDITSVHNSSTQDPEKSDGSDTDSHDQKNSTTNKETSNEAEDIFASIIDHWTDVLEDIPEEAYVTVDELAIDISDFLDIKSEFPSSIKDEDFNKPSDELEAEHRNPMPPIKSENAITTEKSQQNQSLEADFHSMAGFLDTSITSQPDFSTLYDATPHIKSVPEAETENPEDIESNLEMQTGQLSQTQGEEKNISNPEEFQRVNVLSTTIKSFDMTSKEDMTFVLDTEEPFESTTAHVSIDQIPELRYPGLELTSDDITTESFLNENFMIESDLEPQTENHARDDLDQIKHDENTDMPDYSTSPVTEITTASTDDENNSTTTAFTIPLTVLKNQVMLNNFLNGQTKNSGSKVVIKEQGSKVAISSPSQSDSPLLSTDDMEINMTGKTTDATSENQQQTTTTAFPSTSSDQAISNGNAEIRVPETNGMHDNLTTTSQQNQENAVYTTSNPELDDITTVISISNSNDNKNSDIIQTKPTLLSSNSDNLQSSQENTTDFENEDSYANIEEILRNTATTNLPTTTEDETKELVLKDVANTLITENAETTTSMSEIIESLAALTSENHPTHTENEQNKESENLDIQKDDLQKDENLTLYDQESSDMQSTSPASTQYQETNDTGNTTTMVPVTRNINDSNLATIIIPSSIVNGLHKENDKVERTEETTVPSVTDTTEVPQSEAIYSQQSPGLISRKDDDGQTDYGGDSPFFIRLPGSQDPVPVFIQYEPVEINYVPTNGEDTQYNYYNSLPQDNLDLQINSLFRDNLIDSRDTQEIESENPIEIMNANTRNISSINVSQGNMVPDSSSENFLINATSDTEQNDKDENNGTMDDSNGSISSKAVGGIYRIIDGMAATINNPHVDHMASYNEESDGFKPNKPIVKRPDPFFVMEAPHLGDGDEDTQTVPHHSQGNNGFSNVQINNNEDRYSVDVSGQYGFASSGNTQERPGTVENVPVGINDGILYPGDYYLHDSYTDVDLKSLVNPVFSLRLKANTPSPEDLLSPQYTPFPITTNPPRSKPLASTSTSTEKAENQQVSDLGNTTVVPGNTSVNTTAKPTTTTTKYLPSIEYSSMPEVDFDDSYSLSHNPDHIFGNEESMVKPQPAQDAEYLSKREEENTDIKEDTGISENSDTSPTINQVIQDPEIQLDNREEDNEKESEPIDHLPIPSDQFMAHEQAWAFPQSREDPDYMELTGFKEIKDVPGRQYMAFHSPRDIPGIDPAVFSYRKVPAPVSSPSQSSASALPLLQGGYGDQVIVDYVTKKRGYTGDALTKEVPEEDVVEDVELIQEDLHDSSSYSQGSEALLDPQFFEYLNSLPDALLRKFLDPTTPSAGERLKRSVPVPGEQIFCEWNIRTEPGLYLLMTFHNLSAAYTVDCHGAYIEVERENNGFDARWCGNRVGQAGTRPHVIFAKSEVRITVYDDGNGNKVMPTGFEADIEVIDLFNARDYTAFMRSNAYPHIRRLLLG